MEKSGADAMDQQHIKKMHLDDGMSPKQISAKLHIDINCVESFCKFFKPPIKKGKVIINE